MRYLLIIASFSVFPFGFTQESSQNSTVETWSLEKCIAYALENNISIQDAELNKNLAEIDYDKSKSARLPNLTGSASQNFSNGNSIDPITSDFVSDQIHSTNAGINSSVTLFKGRQLNNQIEQNKILLDQSNYLQEIQQNDIVLNILETYLLALYSKENITIAENNLLASETEEVRAKALLDAGTFSLSEYTEAQSQVASNKYNVIVAKNDYQKNIIALKQLLELSPLEEIEIEEINENQEAVYLTLDKGEVYNKALGVLPEIQVSELNIAASEKQLEIVKGAYYPTLTLSGSVGTGYTSINQNPFRDQFALNFNQRIGLSLVVPIFNRNQTKAAVQTATINIEKAEIQKQLTEKTVYTKIETAHQNAISAQEQVLAAEASKLNAEESYKLAQKKYELGGLSTTDLIIIKNAYTNAQQNYIRAKYLNILYYQLLEFYQGNDIKL